jgi:hypothetical protein
VTSPGLRRRRIVGESENGKIARSLMALKEERRVTRFAMLALIAAFVAGCNSGPSQSDENTVGGANVVSSAKAPFKDASTSLTLDWGPKAKTGNFVIANVLTYGGAKPTITAPAGWQLINDASNKTTRQSLYGHTVLASDSSTSTWTFSEPVDAQGAIVVLDNVASGWPVDVSSHNAGDGGAITAKSIVTTSDGDLILSFFATDFGAYRPHACTDCGGLNPRLPPEVAVVINQESAAREYWILASYQNQIGETEPQVSEAAQIYNWAAAQVAIKRAATGATTPSP